MPTLERNDKAPVSIIDLIRHFNDWGTNVWNIDIDRTTYYLAARSFLEKCKGVPLEQLPLKFNQEVWSVSTYNERVSLLKNFFLWLIDSEIISKNPLKGVRRKKKKRKWKNPKREPLEKEIIQLLHAVKNNTYCPPASTINCS